MEDPRRTEALRIVEEMAERHKLVDLSASVEVQLRVHEEAGPVLAILSRAQEEAADAMVKLTQAPVDRPDVIRDHQNAVWRYERLVRWLREILIEGKEAGRAIDEARAEYLRDLVFDDETRAAIGLPEPQAPSE